MFSFIAGIVLSISVQAAPVAPAQCETLTNSVTGISVTVCQGSVVRACDAAGNCHGPVSSY